MASAPDQRSVELSRRRMRVAIPAIVALLGVAAIVVGANAGNGASAGPAEPEASDEVTAPETAEPRPAPAEVPPPASVATFDRAAHSLDDPASIWVVVNKLRPLNPQ